MARHGNDVLPLKGNSPTTPASLTKGWQRSDNRPPERARHLVLGLGWSRLVVQASPAGSGGSLSALVSQSAQGTLVQMAASLAACAVLLSLAIPASTLHRARRVQKHGQPGREGRAWLACTRNGR